VGVANLRSGLTGSVVHPIADNVIADGLTGFAWFLVPPILLVRFAVAARGRWPLAAAVWLVLATPLVAAFSYAVGPYDTQPWWEAISGLLTAIAGLCLLGAAAFSSRSRTHESADTVASPAPAGGAASPSWPRRGTP
jgi:peptidoglycan/LPS O-acetylase OafA/YrhL